MSNNGPLRTITFADYMQKPMFQVGFDDAQWGLAFRKDYERWSQSAQWAYERGRQFGIIAKVTEIKKGKRLHAKAIALYSHAREAKIIP